MISDDKLSQASKSEWVGRLLAAIGDELLSSDAALKSLRGRKWREASDPVLRQLSVEGFVNGAFLTRAGAAFTRYRSALVDQVLAATELTRSDLKDLSRTASIDKKIDALPWAEQFSRRQLLALTDNPAQRKPLVGDTTPFDVVPWLKRSLQQEFPRATPSHNGVLFPLRSVQDAEIYGFIAVRDGFFPVALKPYVVVSIDISAEDVLLAISQDRRILHPLWILALDLGCLLISMNREQLDESLAVYTECFQSIEREPLANLRDGGR